MLDKYANFNLNNIDNCIIKISPTDNLNFIDIVNKFDKIILLYRKNVREQAESFVWAKHKKIYHHSYIGDKFVYAHYTIDDAFLKDNAIEIEE
jgi:GTP-binding protein EngB required for normal cell division